MNKRLYHIGIIGTLALALAACSRTESVLPSAAEDYIRFGLPGMSVDVEAKSALVGDALPDSSRFGVLGYCLSQIAPDDTKLNESSAVRNWDDKKELCRPHLFYDKEVTYNGGACTYEAPVKWYDDVNSKYTFFAYYPYEQFTIKTTASALGTPTVTFSMPFAGTNINQELEGDVPDAMVAMAKDAVRGTDGMVELEFHHLLVGMNFTVNNYSADTASAEGAKDLVIHSLKLQGTFNKSLVVRYDEGWEYPGDTYSGTYVLLGDEEGDGVTVEPSVSVENIGGRTLFFVFGESTTGGLGHLGQGMKLLIDYTFDGKRTTNYVNDNIPFNSTPVRGTIYTMQLNFVGDSFVLNMVTDSNQWGDGSNTDITFE